MGHIRDRMDADLRLAGHSESTRNDYLGCAQRFVKHFMRPPSELGEAEVREFLLMLLEVRKVSIPRYRQYLAALKFLFVVTLRRPEVVAGLPAPRKQLRSRVDVMTREEVAGVLGMSPTPFWHAYFTTAYAAGLRRMEVAGLRSDDIDTKSGLIRVARGKGGKAREVKLDPSLLDLLRVHWRRYALPGPWLFPSQTRFGGWEDRPVNLHSASHAFRDARIAANVARPVTLHSLRHAFATHMLEDGVNVIVLQQALGHVRVDTTQGYTQVCTDQIRAMPSLLSKLPR